MGSKIDRTREVGYNNFGSKMIIKEYRNAKDIDVYFPEYDWIAKHKQYCDFKIGNIKCPYERRVYGVGCIGEGKYKAKENGKLTKCYITWINMLMRCYNKKYYEKNLTYINCKVSEEWLDYQNFSKWYEENYYEIKGQKMDLDKDILYKGNKIYSPENCIFVPHNINILFVKHDKDRGDYPIGVYYHKVNRKFVAKCSIYDFKINKTKQKHLGIYDTPKQAFEVYKEFKENNMRDVADYYKEQIPVKLYNALYKYEVEIND